MLSVSYLVCCESRIPTDKLGLVFDATRQRCCGPSRLTTTTMFSNYVIIRLCSIGWCYDSAVHPCSTDCILLFIHVEKRVDRCTAWAKKVRPQIFKTGEYLAKLQARTWLYLAFSSSFSSESARCVFFTPCLYPLDVMWFCDVMNAMWVYLFCFKPEIKQSLVGVVV